VSAAPSAASAPAIAPRGAARALAALLVGVVFGAGLAIAQMTDPRKVLNFLDLTGRWDASLLFVLGGAVAGGRVLADWPGLSARALYQQRDLKPTLDLRSVMKSVLHDHLQIATGALNHDVFPDSGAAPYIAGLLRADEA